MPSKPHKSAAESPKLSASIILLHGQVHPLPAHLISTPTLFAVEEEMNVSSQAAGGMQKCVPHVLCSVSSVHLCSLFCCHFLSFVWFGFCACTTAPATESRMEHPSLTHQSRVFYNVKATVLAPLAFLPDDIFVFVP